MLSPSCDASCRVLLRLYCNFRITSPPDALLHLELRIYTAFAEFALLELGHKKQSNCERSDASISGGLTSQNEKKEKKLSRL